MGQHLNFKNPTKLEDAFIENGKIHGYGAAAMIDELNPDMDGLGEDAVFKLMFNHQYILNRKEEKGFFKFGKLSHPNGRFMEGYTTAPGVFLYTGDYIPYGLVGKGGVPYAKRRALCLETSAFVDSINVDENDPE